MRYKVRPWENYVVTYPGSNLPMHTFHSGSVVDIEDKDRDTQGHKLVELTEEELKELETPAVIESPAKVDDPANEKPVTQAPKADLAALADQLRNGKKGVDK